MSDRRLEEEEMTMLKVNVRTIIIFIIVSILFLFKSNIVYAEMKTYIGTDIYIMSESDNLGKAKSEAKKKALRNAQEQAGVYVSSYTKVKNNMVTEDEIITITNGILEVIDVDYEMGNNIDDINGIPIKAIVTVQIDTDKIDNWLDKEIEDKHNKRRELDNEIQKKNQELQNLNSKIEQLSQKQQQPATVINNTTIINNNINVTQQLNNASRLLDDNKPKPAMEIINNVRQFETDNYYTYYLMGVAHYKMKKYDTAIEYFNKSIQLNKTYNWSYHGLGVVYYDLKEYWIANQYFTKALQYKQDELTYSWRGLTYSKMGKKDLAQQDYEMSKKIFHSKY